MLRNVIELLTVRITEIKVVERTSMIINGGVDSGRVQFSRLSARTNSKGNVIRESFLNYSE